MDPVRRTYKPSLRRPRAIVAFEGWNDASNAASGALAYLLGQFDAEPFAVIDPEEFVNFQLERPVVSIDDGGTRSLTWPVTRFYAVELPDRPHDLVLVLGSEPHHRWMTFSRNLTRVLSETGVEQVMLLGAFIAQVPHTLPLPIIGVSTIPDEVKANGLIASRYQGPTGIVGVVLEACREEGMPALSMWGATPHYLSANPNPMAMLALLTKASQVLDLPVDTTELSKVAGEFASRVDSAMQQSNELSEYVRRLEKDTQEGKSEPARELDFDSAQLVKEVEQFLRDNPA